jgi:hypothetical protein
MNFMYISGQEWNFGQVNAMLPFYAYLHRMFRKTLAPREGDQSNVSNYGRDLLKHMSLSEPEFSVVDYIWEEIHTIFGSPQKSCGYAPYIMHVIEAIANYTFVYDHEHKPFHLKNDVVGPSLADWQVHRQNLEAKKSLNSLPQLLHHLGQQGLHMVEGVDVGNKCKSPLLCLESYSTFGLGLA